MSASSGSLVRERWQYTSPHRRQLPFSTIVALVVVGTAGVYITPLNAGGLSIRLFEACLLAWAIVYLAGARVRVDALMIGFYGLVMSVFLALASHGFEMEGVLLVLRLTVAGLLVLLIREGINSRLPILVRAYAVWRLGALIVVGVGVCAWFLAVSGVFYSSELVFRSVSGYRVQSVVLDPNRFGSFSAILFSVSLVNALLVPTGRFRSILATLIAALAVLLSGSRGALIAGVLGSLAAIAVGMVAARRVERRRMRWRLLIVGALLAVPVVVVISMESRNIFARLAGDSVKESDRIVGNIRIKYALEVIDKVRRSPVNVLTGTGDYGRVERAAQGTSFSPHNTYLVVLAAQGVLGLAVYLALIGAVVVRALHAAFSARKQVDDRIVAIHLGLLAGLFTLIVHGASVVLYTTGFIWIFVGLVWASSTAVLTPGRTS